MLFKKVVLFGLFLSCIYQSYAYQIANDGVEQKQQETEQKYVFCHYNIGDWYGDSKYDEQSDEIIIENCNWGNGWNCSMYKIPKLSEFDDIKVYYSEKHPENIFIHDNGIWKWKNSGCDFADKPIENIGG